MVYIQGDSMEEGGQQQPRGRQKREMGVPSGGVLLGQFTWLRWFVYGAIVAVIVFVIATVAAWSTLSQFLDTAL